MCLFLHYILNISLSRVSSLTKKIIWKLHNSQYYHPNLSTKNDNNYNLLIKEVPLQMYFEQYYKRRNVKKITMCNDTIFVD